MAITANFTTTPNNSSLRISHSDPLDYLDWTAGDNGGRLQQIYVRAVADQAVVVNLSVKIGNTIYPIVRIPIPPIAIADDLTSSQPPTPLLTEEVLASLALSPEGRALHFASGDGIRVSQNAMLDAGETVTVLALGGDF